MPPGWAVKSSWTMRSLASFPIAENMSANFVICSGVVLHVFIFRELQKYGSASTPKRHPVNYSLIPFVYDPIAHARLRVRQFVPMGYSGHFSAALRGL